jgi:hypothetical protein
MNTSNSRNVSNNWTAKTVGTPAKAGMLAKVLKTETACKEVNNSTSTIYIRDASSSSREASTFSRDASNGSRTSQLKHWQTS